MMTEHDQWLMLTQEEALEPELPICDSHHHLRKLGDFYGAQDLMDDIGDGHNIVSTVFVQSYANLKRPELPEGLTPVEETEWVIEDAAGAKGKTAIAAKIVSYADLNQEEVAAATLEALIEAGKERFCGIRFNPFMPANIVNAPDAADAYSWAPFREGFKHLAARSLSYDLVILRGQYHSMAKLAGSFPDTPIIINHVAWPYQPAPTPKERAELYEDFKAGLEILRPYENIYLKIGGLGQSYLGFGMDVLPRPLSSTELADMMLPYYLYPIEIFGPERCMFESNFPVDKESHPYNVYWNAFKRMTQSFSGKERAALFHDTAAKAYGL